jgi:hypothetical protein
MTRREALYVANATVLLTHQMEGAASREWTLFHLPGQLTLYLVLNVPLVAVVLVGARAQVLNQPHARLWARLLAGAGLFAVCFHSAWLLAGDSGFRLPISVALLTATLALSIAQLVDAAA